MLSEVSRLSKNTNLYFYSDPALTAPKGAQFLSYLNIHRLSIRTIRS